MKRCLVIAFCVLISMGCSKKHSTEKRDVPFSSGSKSSAAPGQPENQKRSQIREIAKSRLRRLDLNTPENLDNSIELLRKLTRDLESTEKLSHAEALNELYIALTENQSSGISLSIRGIFARAMLNNTEKLSSIMNGLPAGEMRRFCLAFIRGKNFSPQQLEEIYLAMPESADRSDIADQFVAQTFYKKGVDPALAFIKSLTSPYEREQALNSLANSIVTGNQIEGMRIPPEIVEQVMDYAKSIGQDYPVRALEKLRAPER